MAQNTFAKGEAEVRFSETKSEWDNFHRKVEEEVVHSKWIPHLLLQRRASLFKVKQAFGKN